MKQGFLGVLLLEWHAASLKSGIFLSYVVVINHLLIKFAAARPRVLLIGSKGYSGLKIDN